MLLRFLYILILTLLSLCVYGQDYVMKGNAAYNTGNYEAAIDYYSKYDKISNDRDILEKRGNAYYKTNELPKAIWDFTRAKKLGNEAPDLYLKMAEIKQHLGELDEATFFYNTFIEQVGAEHPNYNRAVVELKNCVFTAFNNKEEDVASIQSFGRDVNTQYDEIYPLQSPRYGNVYYLSSNRNLNDFNLYSYSINEKGDWQAEQEFVKTVNTAKHDYLQDISPDGQALLYQKHGAESSDRKVTFSTYNEDEEIKVDIPRNILHDIEDLQIINHNTLAFASKKLEGHGGYDIYTITYKDGKWSLPVNAGPLVNTMHDDRFPFYSTTQKELYYSSNRPYGYGGYDVYHNVDLSKDVPTKNIGQPINGAGDDINFRIDNVGHTAIFSSNRKTGEGGYDLYFAYMINVNARDKRDSIQFQFLTDTMQKKVDEIAAKRESKKQKALQREQEVRQKKLKKEKEQEKEQEAKEKREQERKEKADAEAIAKAEKERRLAEAEKLKKELLENKVEKDNTATATIESDKKDATIKTEVKKENKSTDIRTTSTDGLALPSEDPKIKNDLYDIKTLEAIQSYVIYYQDRQDLLNKENKPIVHAIAHNLSENQDHNIRLLVYTDYAEPGLPEFVQYNTLLRAKTISDYLVDMGIAPERIHTESLAANYPIARKKVAGKENLEYSHLNKRIEVQIVDSNGKIIQDDRIDPTIIPLANRDRKYILFQDIRDELYYSVKVASTPRIFKNVILRMYDDIYVRREAADAPNDYYIGIYTKYADAKALQEKLSKSTAPLSDIVAFYNGKLVEEADIKALTAEYPDLGNYGEQ